MSEAETWNKLRRFTDARIGLGRSGSAMPTREVLNFAMAHAQARDAVMTPIDWAPVEAGLEALSLQTMRVASAAADRDTYLRRPDLGRRLSDASAAALDSIPKKSPGPDVLIFVGDGLSSKAVDINAVAMITALLPRLQKQSLSLAPVVLASQSRVALGDDAGERLGASAVVVLIGERPGLSSPDSLGIYLTWQPRVGRNDAERNCISNVRTGGLSYDEAAFKLAWLIAEAFKRRLTGVTLKDESDYLLAGPSSQPLLG